MTKLKEKLSKMTTDQPSDWKQKAKYCRYTGWLEKSVAISVQVLDVMKAHGLS